MHAMAVRRELVFLLLEIYWKPSLEIFVCEIEKGNEEEEPFFWNCLPILNFP